MKEPPRRSDPGAHDYDPELHRCLLCGSSDLRAHHRDSKGRRIQRCFGCGIQFMNPQYTDSYLTAYYARYYAAGDEDEEAHRYQHDTNLDLLESRTGGPGRLLDIGCGQGHLLRAARDRGWQVTGYDVDPATVRKVAAEHDLEILAGDLLTLDLPDRAFDVITLNHVLEHLKQPAPLIRRIGELLAPGGLLLISVPNIAGLSNRLKFRLEKLRLRRKGIGAYYDADHHLWYFAPDTLQRFLESRGFEILHRQSAPKVRRGEAAWKRNWRRRTTDRLLQRSSFLMICGRR